MGGYCLVTRTSFESIFITELSSIDLLGFSFHFNKYDELISAIGTSVRQILAAASRLYSWRLECFATGSPPTPAPALLASTRVAASPKTRSQVAGRTARNPSSAAALGPGPNPARPHPDSQGNRTKARRGAADSGSETPTPTRRAGAPVLPSASARAGNGRISRAGSAVEE
jgi:hypothetical protein